MKLLVLPSQGLVTQADLENVLSLENQIRRLERTRDRIAAGILARLNAGHPVEPGPRSYELEESYTGGVRRQKLIVR